MTDVSEFEDVVENFMAKAEFKECLDYIETQIDPHVVLTNTYLFENKLNCLYELNRKTGEFNHTFFMFVVYLFIFYFFFSFVFKKCSCTNSFFNCISRCF